MGIIVKEVTDAKEKSVQEIEQELLVKHEEQFNDETSNEPTGDTIPKVDLENKEEAPVVEEIKEEVPYELKEEDILSYIKEKYGREVNSMEELTKIKEEEVKEELPEDVAAYFNYKKETGRGIDDYAKLNSDVDSIPEDRLIKEYLLSTEEGLDEEDILDMMEDYNYDEEYDEESDIKKIKLNKKKTVAKAKRYFNEQKEKYGVPLESSGSAISNADEGYEEYKQYIETAKTVQEENQRKSEWFTNQTDKVFSNEFKGFEFKIDDNSLTFSPGDAAELKSLQSNPQNFINKFLDEQGMVSDAAGYHKALSVAMNPDKFAKFFYEQGKSMGTEDITKKMKNINMSERGISEVSSKGGTQVKSLGNDSGSGLRIKSRKK